MSIQSSAGGIPVVILKEGAQQAKGRDAQKNNIAAAQLIAEIVHASLGPRGMDKLLVESLGNVTITSCGATIQKAVELLEKIADKVSATDKDVLERIARTSMQTKLVRRDSASLADMIVKSVIAVAEKKDDGYLVDIDNIFIMATIISMKISQKREDIEIMRLVGAT